MGVKISDLTAKGSKIASTDIVEVSVDTGLSFVSRKVTGSELNELSLDTSPQLGGNLDVNANKITSASNGNIKIEPGGTGAVLIGGNDIQPAELRFMELLGNGNSYVGFKAPADIVTNKVYTLPLVDGTNGQVLSTNGSGVLSFATAGGGITVGTTAVTSGTDGRVFFQAGGVVQQDSAFFWDNTNKRLGVGATPASTVRLDVRAQGALSTDIAFRVRNSADTQNLMSIAGNGDVAIGLNATGVTAAGYPFTSIGSGAKASQYGLSIGTNAGANQDNGDRRNIYIGHDAASSGTNRTAYANIAIGNRALLAINSGQFNIAIGLGPSSGEGAGEAISTGSENVIVGVGAGASITTGGTNTNIGRYAGAQNVTGASNTQVGYAVDQGTGTNKSHITAIGMRLRSSHNGVIMLGSSGNTGVVAPSIADDAAQFHFRSTSQSFFFNKNTNVVLRSNSALTSGTHFEAAATNTFTIHNGTAPVANIADAYAQYSADITAGNAAPHFRTENGNVIKIYRETTAVVAAAFVANTSAIVDDTATFGGYTMGQVVAALKAQGLLA
jgi:hypothetical protein